MKTSSDLLLETARRGELHHAVILHGPSAPALRVLAAGIARALNCHNNSTGDTCASCRRVDARSHPDVHWTEVAADRKFVSVDQIREIVSEASLRPYEGRAKVFIVDPASSLTENGSNALLKTLEEPPRDTHFLLLARAPDLLLPTIRSRSQAIYVGGEEETDEELRAAIEQLLARFAKSRESVALLTVAALVAQHEKTADAIALLAAILARGAADGRFAPLGQQQLLAAADGALAAIRALNINADPRLTVEQALAHLV